MVECSLKSGDYYREEYWEIFIKLIVKRWNVVKGEEKGVKVEVPTSLNTEQKTNKHDYQRPKKKEKNYVAVLCDE